MRRECRPFWIWLSKRMVGAHPRNIVGTKCTEVQIFKAQGSRLRNFCFSDESFDFGSLRRVWRKTTKQVLCSRCRIGAAACARKRDREPEARLVQIGIDRQRSLQWID